MRKTAKLKDLAQAKRAVKAMLKEHSYLGKFTISPTDENMLAFRITPTDEKMLNIFTKTFLTYIFEVCDLQFYIVTRNERLVLFIYS